METNVELTKDKIDQVNGLAWEVRVNDSNKALLLSEEAIELAKTINYTKGKAEGLRTLGFSYIRLSKHTEAQKYLEESLKLFELLNDQRGQSDVYEYLGIILRSFGDYKASLDILFKSLELRQQNTYREGESLSLYHLGVTYKYLGDLEQALESFLQSLSIARQINFEIGEAYDLNNIGGIYFELGDYDNALKYYDESLVIRKQSGDKWGEAGCLDNIGYIHFRKKNYTGAKTYCESSLSIARNIGDRKGEANSLFHLAEIYQTDDRSKAETCAVQCLQIREEIGDKKGQAEVYLYLSENATNASDSEKTYDQQFEFLHKAFALGNEIKALDLLYKIHYRYYQSFKEQKQYATAIEHLELSYEIEKEIHSNIINQKIQNLEINHMVAQSKKEAEIFRLRNVELASLYEESKKQKEEIEKQKASLEHTLEELKSTQVQLIHSEKLALLGGLTAGIAHEIQNPLNFVNNFSEVNTELIEELKNELSAGNNKDAISIAGDIKENEQKINHHGKRADAIVKAMLQHSRKSTGQKELTDINALADEYLRLSYHGLRAKEKTFNTTLQTDFDINIEKINIVPQDIGRVLLNLFTNAFYAVTEKKKLSSSDYEPTVTFSTKLLKQSSGGFGVEIRIKDNGVGITQSILDKIYEPFFTTKPTGQGTGLGLSLSYDIIKSHGGELKVESKEGEFAEFIIQLPIA
jgi:two-component system, NtrC family, sensor kinase